MALSALESIVLTCAICAAVHLLVAIMESIDRPDNVDYKPMMKSIMVHRFMGEQRIPRSTFELPFYH